MNEGSERRRELRLEQPLVVYLEVRAEDPILGSTAEIVACSCVDVSAGGLQLLIDRTLPTGAILRLGTDPPGDPLPMQIVGEVRWVRPEGHGFRVGFAFFDSDGTDIIAWKQYIAQTLRR